MGSNNSIGSLFIDIQARTAKLEQDMGKVRGILQDTAKDTNAISQQTNLMSATTQANIARFAAAMMGAQTMVRILARDIREVVMNIDNMKGINPQVVASVQRLRDNLFDARGALQSGIATAVGFASDFSTAIGVGMATVWGHIDKITDASGRMVQGDYKEEITDLDKLAEAQDATYGERVKVKLEEIAMKRLAAARALKPESEQIKELLALSERYMKIAGSKNFNSLARAAYGEKGLDAELQANAKLRSMQDQLKTAEEAVAASTEKGARAYLSAKQQVEALTEKVWGLRVKLADLAAVQRLARESQGKEDPALLERQIELTKQLAQAQQQLAIAQKRYGEFYRELGDAMANSFERSILQGAKLKEILRSLAQDIIAVLFRRLVTNQLADMLTSFLGGLGGSAAGGPIEGGKPRLVGEFGPEIIYPSSHSTVVPNDQLRGGGGGGGDLNIVYHIAPGVTRGELLPILEAHGRKIKADVADGVRRGGGYRSAFAG